MANLFLAFFVGNPNGTSGRAIGTDKPLFLFLSKDNTEITKYMNEIANTLVHKEIKTVDNYLILPHLGLGDQFILNGYVQYILQNKKPKNILLFAYNNYQVETLKHLYSDCSSVEFFFVDYIGEGIHQNIVEQLSGLPFETSIQVNKNGEMKDYCLLNLGVHSQYRTGCFPNHSWADTFYIQGRLDPSYRYKLFTLPSNMNRSDELYRKITEKVGKEYILVHDDPSRGRYMNESFLHYLLSKSKNEHLPVLYLGKNRYSYPTFQSLNSINVGDELFCNSLLDLCKVIQNAKECHIMDSSICCLIELMEQTNSSLHIHAYIRESIDEKNKVFVSKNWNIWFQSHLDNYLKNRTVNLEE